MKDTTIKHFLLTSLVILAAVFVYSNPKAMTFEDEGALLLRPEQDPEQDNEQLPPGHANMPANVSKKPKKIVPVKLEKNKSGLFKAKWSVLAEFDLEKKQAGMNLKKLIGKKVEVSGFMMPLDYSAKNIKEFLLVPYVPSCSHVPPPPNNQIISVKVKGKQGVQPLYYPVQMEGILQVSQNKKSSDPYMPSGVFEMTVSKVEKHKRERKKKTKKK